jgi:aminoglycoside phosphotransferase family enzyme
VLGSPWQSFAKGISELEKLASQEDPTERGKKLESLMTQNAEIIVALTAILNDMIDIQDFNEVIDMVREMLEDQSEVLDKTKAEQKRRLLEALK